MVEVWCSCGGNVEGRCDSPDGICQLQGLVTMSADNATSQPLYNYHSAYCCLPTEPTSRSGIKRMFQGAEMMKMLFGLSSRKSRRRPRRIATRELEPANQGAMNTKDMVHFHLRHSTTVRRDRARHTKSSTAPFEMKTPIVKLASCSYCGSIRRALFF